VVDSRSLEVPLLDPNLGTISARRVQIARGISMSVRPPARPCSIHEADWVNASAPRATLIEFAATGVMAQAETHRRISSSPSASTLSCLIAATR
jgi:hypothetical protein